MGSGHFCSERGIAASSFFAWRRKLASAARSSMDHADVKPAAFVEIRQADPVPIPGLARIAPAACLELHLRPGGVRALLIHAGFDAALLRELIVMIEGIAPAPRADGAAS